MVAISILSPLLQRVIQPRELEAFVASSFTAVDQSKMQRQMDIVSRWHDNGCKGIVEACTGFGKSFVAILVIWMFNKLRPDTTVLVVLPSEHLRSQWTGKGGYISKYGFTVKITAITIHTALKRRWNADLLICDEVHRYAAGEWIKMFDKVNYQWALGLSGTLERQDQRHYMLFDKIGSVVDRVTYAEAKEKGWVTDALIINYGIQLPPNRMLEYKAVDEAFSRFSAFMPGGMYIVNKILTEANSRKHNGFDGPGPILKAHCEYLGKDADNQAHADEVIGYAVNFMRYMQKRKGFIYNAPEKVQVVKSIIDEFPDHTIVTFSESQKICDAITKAIPGSTSYHSKMPKYRRDRVTAEFGKVTNVLNTVRALDEGFDLPGIDMGIVVAGSSVVRQSKQRRGRAIRIDTKNPDKRAIMIELYLIGTQDAAWVRKRQDKELKKTCEIIWIENDFAELTEAIKKA